MSDTIIHTVDIALQVPVPVAGADGKTAERSKITLRRPKVRHAKKLAVLIGADVLDLLMSEDDIRTKVGAKEGEKLLGEVVRKLLAEERLDGLTALIAALANEDKETIDELDLIDLKAIGLAFASFFPALQSVLSGMSQPSSPSLDATTLAS